MRHWRWILVLIGLCGLLALRLNLYRKSNTPRQKRLLQEIFASEAESLKQGAFKSAIATPEGVERRKQAIKLLSNGVFDKKVLLVGAQVRPPSKSKYEGPLFRGSPSLCWWVVDELGQVASVGYSDSNDPNAFGTPLVMIDHYYLLIGDSEKPKHIWSFPLKCYKDNDTRSHPYIRLMKHDDGISQARVSLEVSIPEWNALLSNRGQLILRDKNNRELNRVKLTPLADDERRKIMKRLLLPDPDKANKPNSTKQT